MCLYRCPLPRLASTLQRASAPRVPSANFCTLFRRLQNFRHNHNHIHNHVTPQSNGVINVEERAKCATVIPMNPEWYRMNCSMIHAKHVWEVVYSFPSTKPIPQHIKTLADFMYIEYSTTQYGTDDL
jgi:hypothetical protein